MTPFSPKLRWLRVDKFRTIKPGTELNFSPTFNVLLGLNGSGKTTLLDLISAAIAFDFSKYTTEEFEITYTLASTVATATIIAKQVLHLPTRQQGAIESARSEPTRTLTLDARFESKSRTYAARVENGLLRVTSDLSSAKWRDVPGTFPGRNGLLVAGEELEMLATGAYDWIMPLLHNNVRRFPEGADALDELLSVSATAAEREGKVSWVRFSGRSPPVDLVTGLLSATGGDTMAIPSAKVRFLDKAVGAFRFASAEIRFQSLTAMTSDQETTRTFGKPRFVFRKDETEEFDHEWLSYGQKRLLAFYYELGTSRNFAVVDELVNGLHHSWIKTAIQDLMPRQVFLTSQNPLLLDYLPRFESPAAVREAFVLCSWSGRGEGHVDRATMTWENMSEEVAQDFFESYQVGFQQVGELLRVKGLW